MSERVKVSVTVDFEVSITPNAEDHAFGTAVESARDAVESELGMRLRGITKTGGHIHGHAFAFHTSSFVVKSVEEA